MAMRDRPRASVLLVVGALGCSLVLYRSAAGAEARIQPGEVLGPENWRKAEGLLPPRILEHYERGEWKHEIVAYPEGPPRVGQDFLEGTEKNRGRFALDDAGTIVEKATGKEPPYIIGFPFPDIDPGDPQAATKILWNYFYQWWYNGNVDARVGVDWIGTSGLDRRMVQRTRFLYYDAQPRELSPRENPQNLLFQFLSIAEQPTDLYGTAALSWRFRDGSKRDNAWAYVPALRRVRAVSPANRSDGFLGSDMSQDDGAFFDGKVQDFSWKFVGEAEMLVPIDPVSLREKANFERIAEGVWRSTSWKVPRMGWELAGWRGLPWAPVSQALTKRKVWIIEGVPKDRYYLYGTIRLIIEQGTFEGRWSLKYDWKGQLTQVLMVGRGIKHSPDGRRFVDYTPVGLLLAENVRLNRATAAGRTFGDTFVDYGVRFDPKLFQYQELLHLGK